MISLFFETLTNIVVEPFRRKEFFQQLHFVANKSLIIIIFCVSFAAIVTILESSFHMKLILQNDSMVPGFAAVLILRELAAVVTALLFASRVGAGYASEIGTMKITEQLEALKMLGIDQINFLVSPRFLACILGAMILTAIANVTCLFAAVVVSKYYLGYTADMFLSSMHRFVHFRDLIFSIIKGACFGAIVPVVACYFGFSCEQGAEGVGRATTNTVVVSSVGIIVADFILSYIFSYFY